MCFWILSLMVWWEILMLGPESNNKSIKDNVFIFFSVAIEFFLLFYFAKSSLYLVVLAVINLMFMAFWAGLTLLILRIFKNKIIKAGKTHVSNSILFAMVSSAIFMYCFFKFLIPGIAPLVKDMLPSPPIF